MADADVGHRTWHFEQHCQPLSTIFAHFHVAQALVVRSLAIAHAAAAASIVCEMLASLF